MKKSPIHSVRIWHEEEKFFGLVYLEDEDEKESLKKVRIGPLGGVEEVMEEVKKL